MPARCSSKKIAGPVEMFGKRKTLMKVFSHFFANLVVYFARANMLLCTVVASLVCVLNSSAGAWKNAENVCADNVQESKYTKQNKSEQQVEFYRKLCSRERQRERLKERSKRKRICAKRERHANIVSASKQERKRRTIIQCDLYLKFLS